MNNICRTCFFYDNGDSDVGLASSCSHESLYDDEGNILEDVEIEIIEYMDSNNCPLKISIQ